VTPSQDEADLSTAFRMSQFACPERPTTAVRPIRMTPRSLLVPAVAAAALILAGCGDGSPPKAEASPSASTETESAQARWEERGPVEYEMTLVSSCGERAGLGTFHVTVTPDRTIAEPIRGTTDHTDIASVDDLFAFIEEATALKADVVDVAYDENLGYPRRIDVDYMVNAIDDEACYRVQDFTSSTT
jgi:hypothetical protein